MAIETVQMYRLLCDRCGVSAQDDGEFYAWKEPESCIEEAGDWQRIEDSYYCPGCWGWNEDGTEMVPLDMATFHGATPSEGEGGGRTDRSL